MHYCDLCVKYQNFENLAFGLDFLWTLLWNLCLGLGFLLILYLKPLFISKFPVNPIFKTSVYIKVSF